MYHVVHWKDSWTSDNTGVQFLTLPILRCASLSVLVVYVQSGCMLYRYRTLSGQLLASTYSSCLAPGPELRPFHFSEAGFWACPVAQVHISHWVFLKLHSAHPSLCWSC